LAVGLLTCVVLGSHGRSAEPVAATALDATPDQAPAYIISDRGLHHRVLQKVVSARSPSGRVISVTNDAYMELATGMHYLQDGQWLESKEEIVGYPFGAMAAQGQHKVVFSENLNAAVVIDLETPEGQRMRSRIVGLNYLDTASGSNVWIAEVKNSQGVILRPNQVLYEDAMTGFKADVLFGYTRAGFDQSVILREKPPLPEAFGLNSASSVLQVWTEFVSAPAPVIRMATIPAGAEEIQNDPVLDFGIMKIGPGRAFAVGQDPLDGVPVMKEWTVFQGRTFLVEQVTIPSIGPQLDELPSPPQVNLKPVPGSMRHVVSSRRLLPEPKLAKAGKGEMRVAKAVLSSPGLVLDYSIVNGGLSNYTFHAGTYYISGAVNLYGTNIMEASAIFKYATNTSIVLVPGALTPWLDMRSTPTQPVVFTAKDCDSVGEIITNSTGNPTNFYANPALAFNGPSNATPITHFRIAHARQAVSIVGSSLTFEHGEITNCQNGFTASGASTAYLKHLLFAGVQTNFNQLYSCSFDLRNTTFSASSNLSSAKNTPYHSAYVRVTNCVLANVNSLSNSPSSSPLTYQLTGGNNGFHNCQMFGSSSFTNVVHPFTAGLAGSYYLTTNSPFVDVGNVNDAGQLGLYHFTTQTNQLKEEHSVVDLGFHYVALAANGNPMDTDGDGAPDYLEDANGNGSYDYYPETNFNDPDMDDDGLPDPVDANPWDHDYSLPQFTITSPEEGAVIP
jgi:hypothetical protein